MKLLTVHGLKLPQQSRPIGARGLKQVLTVFYEVGGGRAPRGLVG